MEFHCFLLSLGSSQKNVSYETKMACYFSSIYSALLLNNKHFSWAHGHLDKEFISQFTLKVAIAM